MLPPPPVSITGDAAPSAGRMALVADEARFRSGSWGDVEKWPSPWCIAGLLCMAKVGALAALILRRRDCDPSLSSIALTCIGGAPPVNGRRLADGGPAANSGLLLEGFGRGVDACRGGFWYKTDAMDCEIDCDCCCGSN